MVMAEIGLNMNETLELPGLESTTPPKQDAKLVRTVELKFFQDDANGEWGVTHKETFDDPCGNSFNAIWDAQMMFHDVFEHAHEFTDKHFQDDAALNVGGEMAAMGAMWYYYSQLGISKRMAFASQSIHPPEHQLVNTTLGMISEGISGNGSNYGDCLISKVPSSRPILTGNYNSLESVLDEYMYMLAKARSQRKEWWDRHHKDKQERDYADGYNKSVSMRKIRDLHRYGYKMAEKLVPNDSANREVLENFWETWDRFTKNNSAEEMALAYKGITVKIFRNEDGVISWEAIFNRDRAIPEDEVEKIILRG